jgi:hypothetical protein
MLTALVVVGVSALLLLAFTFLRRKSPAALRPITAFEKLNRAVGLAVENGTRLHFSLGRGDFFSMRGGSALAGLAMLRRLTERTSVSDRPPVVTSGDPAIALLSQDTLQAGYQAAGADEQYRPSTGRLAGLSPFAYAAGTVSVIRDESVSANVLVGDFGAEAALLAEAADRENTPLIAASDNLSAQAVLYAAAQEPLIGEELYASGAYVGAGSSHEASVQVQDVLRWLVILAILAGAALRLVGVNF